MNQRTPFWRISRPLTWSVALLLLSGPVTAQTGGQTVTSHGDEIVATIGDVVIRMRDLERYWQAQDPLSFARLQQQVYEARKRVLDGLIGEHLLQEEAKKRGIRVDQLLAQVLPPLTQPTTEAEIQELYVRSPAASQRVTLEQARSAITAYLQRQKWADARRRYVGDLTATGPVITVRLEMSRQAVKIGASDPVMGSASAPVEIVEFADFECSFCKRAAPILRQVVSKYPGLVKLVWKDFPLPNHSAAGPSAEAAECANEVAKFWEYHDVLFRNQEALTPADLKKYAADLGLDATTFDQCFDSGEHRNRVLADMQEGKLYGVAATPTVFINGRMVMGAVRFETYEQIVLEELAASKTANAAK